jgi:hypothetical protein
VQGLQQLIVILSQRARELYLSDLGAAILKELGITYIVGILAGKRTSYLIRKEETPTTK